MEGPQPIIREDECEFDNYEDLDCLLGSGTQGKVVKVRSFKDDTEYAMKIVDAERMSN